MKMEERARRNRYRGLRGLVRQLDNPAVDEPVPDYIQTRFILE